jgi:hypothetical protein
VPELHDLLVRAGPTALAPPDLDAVRATVRHRRRRRQRARVAGVTIVVAGVVALGLVTATDGSSSAGDDGPVDIGPGPTTDLGTDTTAPSAPDGNGSTADSQTAAAQTPMVTSPLSPRTAPAAVWTGEEVVIWGGVGADASFLSDGAAWNPDTDTWRVLAPAPITGGPAEAVWTGQGVVVAVRSEIGIQLSEYDPISDSWGRLGAEVPGPQIEGYGLAADGSGGAVVWGGPGADGPIAARFEPDQHRVTVLDGPDRAVSVPHGAWTGTELVTWLSTDTGIELVAVDPATDEWRIITTDAPVPWGPAVVLGRSLVVLACLEVEPCAEHVVDLDTGAVTTTQTALQAVVRLEQHGDDVLAVANAGVRLARRDATAGWWPVEPPGAGWCCGAAVVADDELIVWGGEPGAASADGWRQPWPPVGGTALNTSPPIPTAWFRERGGTGVTFVSPPGWATPMETPYLLADAAAEIVTLSTADLPRPDPLACRDVPTTALLALGEDDALVSITERLDDGASQPEPGDHITLALRRDARTEECLPDGQPADVQVGRVTRTFGPRVFDLYIAARGAVSDARIEQLQQMVLGLRAESAAWDPTARAFQQDRDWMELYDSVTGAPPDVATAAVFFAAGPPSSADLYTMETWPDPAVPGAWCWRVRGGATWCTADDAFAGIAWAADGDDAPVLVAGIAPLGTVTMEITCDGATLEVEPFDVGLPVAVFAATCPAGGRNLTATPVP